MATQNQRINGIVHKNGVPVLTLEYGPELMFKMDAAGQLSEALIDEYRRQKGKTKSCVVIIKAETAGSPLVRALFELYKMVEAEGGEVIVVGYPDDYIGSLTTLGLPSLSGFSLNNDENNAVRELAPPN